MAHGTSGILSARFDFPAVAPVELPGSFAVVDGKEERADAENG
jgi:hypothetical protein